MSTALVVALMVSAGLLTLTVTLLVQAASERPTWFHLTCPQGHQSATDEALAATNCTVCGYYTLNPAYLLRRREAIARESQERSQIQGPRPVGGVSTPPPWPQKTSYQLLLKPAGATGCLLIAVAALDLYLALSQSQPGTGSIALWTAAACCVVAVVALVLAKRGLPPHTDMTGFTWDQLEQW